MNALTLRVCALLAVLLTAGLAHAAPLSNTQLDVFQTHLGCRTRCDNGRLAQLNQCRTECDTAADGAGADRADWDKNKSGAVDTVDYELAVLENRDAATGTLICYESQAVVPKNACGLANCLATRTAAQCADADNDGLRQFQEQLIGTSDATANTSCAANAQCGGFNAECRFVTDVNRSLCMPRACAANSSCTAFHVEPVVQDNSEVIVRVVYDYTPTPATVLDLKIAYSQSALTLVDARPLDALTRNRKTLTSSQNPAGFVRLVVMSDVVLDQVNTVPIPFGPIVELVFARTSSVASNVAFVTDDFAQTMSLAPNPGQYRGDLANDALWGCVGSGCQGNALAVAAQDPKGKRMMLYYSFDNAARPLDYSDAKSGEALCALVPECRVLRDAVPAEKQTKTQLIARYAQLQRGVVDTNKAIEGVNGPAAFFDGLGNHLELPVTVNDPQSGAYVANEQGFSLSTWFYNEGDAQTGTDGQVLFSHNTQSSELSRFGLLIAPQGSGATFDLVFFEGEYGNSGARKVTVASGLTSRRWNHVGMTVDTATRQLRFYLNGSAAGSALTLNASPALMCPELETSPGTGVRLHNFGDGLASAKTPDNLFLATAQNNLLGIEQMDLNGLSRRTLLRTGDSSAQDPDYSPVVDRLVFSSSRSGSFEIWLSNADGSNPIQLTKGFGDTARGIFARRPKWAPDGSGIVFESNAFDRNYLDTSTNPATIGDNLRIRAYHLFYIAYDALNNTPAIPVAGGATVAQLDYAALIQNGTVRDYRLTTSETNRHHYDAFWLRGKFTESGVSYLGEVVFSRADAGYRSADIGRVLVKDPINQSALGTLAPFATNDGSDLRLLTARRARMAGQLVDTTRMLLAKEWSSYDAASQYAMGTPTEASGELTVTLSFNPTGYAATCWDTNRDRVCQADENRNGDLDASQNNKCDVTDCYPSSVRDLYVRYDSAAVSPVKSADGEIVATPSAALTAAQKQLALGDNATSGAAYLKVEVLSPYNDKPLVPGTLVQVKFTRLRAGATGLSATQRTLNQRLYTWTDGGTPVEFVSADMDAVQDARFSPGLDRLALSGIQGARPIVARTAGILSTAGMQKLSTSPVKVEGLDWEPVVRAYPCNWIGTYRNPSRGVYTGSFRGALDELRMYSYVRPADAFASEAARGSEQLVNDGNAGAQPPANGSCTSSLGCPSYQVCDAGTCKTKTCSPNEAYPCSEGTCTLLPVPLDDGREVAKWVCSVECVADSQCFEQECMNGPCRFCGTASACVECQQTTQQIDQLMTISYVEGCPDRNGFACDQGSCVSECYSFENGMSQYLCDPVVEYCKQGRCVLNKWDWTDFAPATLAGLGETVRDGIPTTIATPQLWPVVIEAYGMEDYVHDPELLVQAKAAGAYSDWFDLGRVTVRNKTAVQALSNKYTLYTPYQITDLRFQLVSPPYGNMNAGATGLTTRDSSFCNNASWSAADRTLCFRRTSSSLAQAGYASNVSALESIMACQGKPNCPSLGSTAQQALNRYLVPGVQSIIVQAVTVGTTSIVFNANTICSYEGQNDPLDPTGRTRAQVFGNLFDPQPNGKNREASNQAVRLRAANPAASWTLVDLRTPASALVPADKAVLNCPYAEYGLASPRAADARASVPTLAFAPAAGGAITENANGCFVARGNTQEPCYEWAGGEVSLDPFNDQAQAYRTLDFDNFHSFGFDACDRTAADQANCSSTRSLRN